MVWYTCINGFRCKYRVHNGLHLYVQGSQWYIGINGLGAGLTMVYKYKWFTYRYKAHNGTPV